jgi:hypothetical protein
MLGALPVCKSLRAVSAALLLPVLAHAQNQWACADDASTIVVVNSGSGSESYTFHMSALSQHDQTLRIRVVTLDADGVVAEVHQTIEWNFGTSPTISVGAGKAIQILDPSDDDTKAGAGSYKKN